MCWRVKARGKSGSSIACTLIYKQGQGLQHRGGSRNLPADPQALAATYLQPFTLKTCGSLLDPGAGSRSWGLGGGCSLSRGSGGDAVLVMVWVECSLSWGSGGMQS